MPLVMHGACHGDAATPQHRPLSIKELARKVLSNAVTTVRLKVEQNQLLGVVGLFACGKHSVNP